MGAHDWRWGEGGHSTKCGGSPTCDPASVQFFVDSERHSALLDPKVFSRHGHVRTPSLRPHCGGPDAGVNLAPHRAGRLRFSLQKRNGNASWEHHDPLASPHCEPRPCRLTIAGLPQSIPERRPALQITAGADRVAHLSPFRNTLPKSERRFGGQGCKGQPHSRRPLPSPQKTHVAVGF